MLGRRYQMETSPDLKNWSATGDPYLALDEQLTQEFEDQSGRQYFRIKTVL